MTPKERAAMQQALLYLEAWQNGEEIKLYEIEDTITALREALAEQAEQEPVLSYHVYDIHTKAGHEFFYEDYKWHRSKPCGVLNQSIKLDLYAAPVRTKDLTDDEIAAACGWKFGQPMYEWVIGLARAVISADREKNK